MRMESAKDGEDCLKGDGGGQVLGCWCPTRLLDLTLKLSNVTHSGMS